MEQGDPSPSSKRSRVDHAIPNGVVKPEPGGGELTIQGVEGSGALVVVEPQTIDAKVVVARLHCLQCQRPLKPPISKCAAGHIFCCRCHGPHSRGCSSAAPPYLHCRELDAFVTGVRVPCRYESFGCKSCVPYHEAPDHQLACAFAPCICPQPGCGFAGSPAMLHGHFVSHHSSWPVAEVRYGKACKLTVPLAPLQRWNVLAANQGRSLFLLSLRADGEEIRVALVCVRPANAAAAQQFWGEVWMRAESIGGFCRSMRRVRIESSDLYTGLAEAERNMSMTVPPEIVKEAPGEPLIVTVQIDKLP